MHTEANQDMQPGKPATDSQATGNVNDAATSNRARTDTIDQAHAAKNEFQMKLGSSDAGDGGGGALSSDFKPETCVADAAVEIPMKIELSRATIGVVRQPRKHRPRMMLDATSHAAAAGSAAWVRARCLRVKSAAVSPRRRARSSTARPTPRGPPVTALT